MFPNIQLGPASLPTSAVLFIVAVYIGLALSEKTARSYGIKPDLLYNLAIAAFIGFVIGGRLAYVGIHWNAAIAKPMDIVSLDESLFDQTGGLAVALLVALVYGQRKELPFWPTLDALTPFFAALMVALGASHLATATAFGKETSLPWGIELRGAIRHPSQIYEIAAALFILSLVGLGKPFPIAGAQFLVFVAWTAGASLFLEAFRGDSILLAGGVRLTQVMAWIVLAAALFGLTRLKVESQKSNG
jgi:phosphatidylglycerol:prolipoprotein diacylglycerol transferase